MGTKRLKSEGDGAWHELRLGDVIELKRGYDLPYQQRQPGVVPVVSSSGPSGFHSESMAKAPGVVTGRYGTLGQVFFVTQDFWPLNTTLYVRDFKGNDPKFISYLLKTIDFSSCSDKAAVPGVNRNDLHEIQVRIPTPPDQRAIANILGTIDDKIELNRRICTTLQAIARTIFKSWFIEFEPVHAKADGRRPTGIDAATARLFPSSFGDSTLGKIPKGWKVSTLKELTSKIGSGATPRGGDRGYVSEGTAFIRSQNVYDSRFFWDGLARINDADAEQLRGVTVQPEDILLNITGASILRTCVVERAVLPARVNQHVAIVRARDGIPARYLHLHLLRDSTKAYLMGFDAGASRQAVTKGHIESVPVLLPSDSVLARFRDLTEPLYLAVDNSEAQNRSLAWLRDALLPRLLRGELRLKHAARFTEGT